MFNIPLVYNVPGLADALKEAQNKKRLLIGLVVIGAVVLFFVLKRRR